MFIVLFSLSLWSSACVWTLGEERMMMLGEWWPLFVVVSVLLVVGGCIIVRSLGRPWQRVVPSWTLVAGL